MYSLKYIMTLGIVVFGLNQLIAQTKNSNYTGSRAPLHQNPYILLPIGDVRPQGWLLDQLIRQKEGMTGHLDELYPLVMGERNGWLGGDGDQWERGPYWVDGLLPLAYILDDDELKAKVKPWVEWSINHQQADGYFGPLEPEKPYSYEDGLQRDNLKDWWPKMVMLKVLQQYYSATEDKRVIELMTKYFHYQLEELPKTPLGHWTFWANRRGGDNLQVIYWLYNITGDQKLLELAEIVHQQTFNWTDVFLHQDHLTRKGSLHCVNIAQGIKEPIIYYQQAKEDKYLKAVDKGFYDLMKYNGQPYGLYGGDEMLHGNVPTQGSELCSAVEMMFSLESMLSITGNLSFADRLEKIAFNALPAQVTDDYMARQYFQQANQIEVSRKYRNFVNPNGATVSCFGLLTGYPCCTANMHQGWPKFTQNLWYATIDGGVAALIYAPSSVNIKVADQQKATITETTNYPFEDRIEFRIEKLSKKNLSFPFELRVPEWCTEGVVMVNGKIIKKGKAGGLVRLERQWNKGDKITLQLPMHVTTHTWSENAVSVEHGPLVYALPIKEEWKKVENTKDPQWYGNFYYEAYPKSDWNYGLLKINNEPLEPKVEVKRTTYNGKYPWNLENNPIKLTIKAKKVPRWQAYNGMAGPLIYSPSVEENKEVEEIELVPYGSTILRISEFPVVW